MSDRREDTTLIVLALALLALLAALVFSALTDVEPLDTPLPPIRTTTSTVVESEV